MVATVVVTGGRHFLLAAGLGAEGPPPHRMAVARKTSGPTLRNEQGRDRKGASESVLFFDGVCVLCNGLVDWCLTRDKNRRIRFAPLQGKTAGEQLPRAVREGLDTLVFSDARGLAVRSTAVLRMLESMGGVWRLAGALMLVPVVARDPVYQWVARNRYRWFGKRAVCRVPSPEDAGRLLP